MKLAALQTLLLDLAGTARVPDLSALDEQDWTRLDAMAHHHWMQPQLHHRHGDNPAIPAAIRKRWREAKRLSAMTALNQQAELRETVAILDAAGLAPIALKGAWLAWHAYPAPAAGHSGDA